MNLLLAGTALVAGTVLGALAVLVLRRTAVHTEADLLRVRAEGAAAATGLREQVAAQQATVVGLERELEALQQQLRDGAAREQEEQRVLRALAPVQETLRSVQGTVADLERQRFEQYGALQQQLTEAQRSTEQVRGTAESLASALRNTSVRGAWGEAQLRRLVENAGLLGRVDFDLQVTTRGEEGVRRPDLVVRLPEGKCIAVDAKVPLAAFIEANEIPEGAGGAEGDRREALLREHVKAVRAHIDALGAKGYWSELHSPEFVVAFLPSESLLSAALAADPTLLDHAFGRQVALASPVNLWAVLKTVAYTWTQQELTEDAQRLFALSRALYDRLATLAQHAERLRGAIEKTVTSYNAFASSLETRVLVTGRQINRMDESRILGEALPIEMTPRPFTAPELTRADDSAA